MHSSIHQALRSAHGVPSGPAVAQLPDLLVAGASGTMGNAVVQRLLGMQRAGHVRLLATQPISAGMRHASAHVVSGDIAHWPAPPTSAHGTTAVVMFDPPRLFYGRERALWTPTPQQLPALAAWLHRAGVRTLAVVLPHAQGSLPQALQHGLANLDEHALAAMGFERLLMVRSAQKPAATAHSHRLHGLAAWMLGITALMVPSREQPVRASKVALLVDLALQHLPPGTWVAAPELVWRAAQGNTQHTRQVVLDWLRPGVS
jgi:hypothetical protein